MIMMTLNCSRFFKRQTRFPYGKLLSNILMSQLLISCAEIYYQPPGHLYNPTNPYQVEPELSKVEQPLKTPAIQEATKPETEKLAMIAPVKKPAIIKPLSPAVRALLAEAEQTISRGDLDTSVKLVERAMRIDARNPVVTYKLANIRLKQDKPRLAENLAKKTVLLAANNPAIKKKSWLLISEARKKQRNFHGANEARVKAENIIP